MNKVSYFFRSLVNMRDHVDVKAAAVSIRGGIAFRGPNVFILACAIVIASVGLNLNSIPVIIGAMLISPLMGPILGFGLGLGTNDTNLVKEALKTIPEQSKFYRCMADVIKWHAMYPEDWELTWAMIQKEWSFDIGCPEGVYAAFNIDAVINSAYILVGLLYGEGDFFKTIDISTRCGQDSDCNPDSAAGILGTMLGYSQIPEYWMPNLREVEDRNFAYTDISLNKVYQMSFDQALQVIGRNGGSIGEEDVHIKIQQPEPVRFEEAFTGHWPVAVVDVRKPIGEAGTLEFNGNGVVVRYSMGRDRGFRMPEGDYVARVEVWLDGTLSETVVLPLQHQSRKQELYYKYNLPKGDHTLSFKWLNPDPMGMTINSIVVYNDVPVHVQHQ